MQVSLKKLNEIFSNAFNSQIELSEKAKREEIEEWDSINHLNLIVEIGDQLNISFTIEEIEQINSLETLIEILKDK